MELISSQTAQSLGEVLLNARTRRGLTQEELGKDSGIGQAAVAKIERNRSVPKVTTLCRYLRALTLTPEEEFDVWHQIRGNVREINWAERLGLTSFEQARHKAKSRLNNGEAYDAYGYIEAMAQLASGPDERALAEMLHANRFKELGLYSLAEQYYNRATVTLGSAGDSMTMSSVLVNLADLHAEQGRYTLADAYIVYALQRELAPSTHAFACLVKGRVKAALGTPEGHREAADWFQRAFDLYGEMEARDTGETGMAWARFHLAQVDVTSSEAARREGGMASLKSLSQRFGPADNPTNPELYARVSLCFAEIQGDIMTLTTAQRLAKKHALRGVMARAKALRLALGATVALLVALGGLAPSSAQALPKRDAELPRVGESVSAIHPGQALAREHGFAVLRDRSESQGDDLYVWFRSLWLDVIVGDTVYKEVSPEDEFSDNGPEK